MKRFHVHVLVGDLLESIGFYSRLFGIEPARVEANYAKWMLDDPFINFAISQRQAKVGLNNLGFQVAEAVESEATTGRLQAADATMVKQPNAACCYARSDKYWVTDPSGIAWETFHTLDAIPVFGADAYSGTPKALPEFIAPSGEHTCCAPALSNSGSPGCCA